MLEGHIAAERVSELNSDAASLSTDVRACFATNRVTRFFLGEW